MNGVWGAGRAGRRLAQEAALRRDTGTETQGRGGQGRAGTWARTLRPKRDDLSVSPRDVSAGAPGTRSHGLVWNRGLCSCDRVKTRSLWGRVGSHAGLRSREGGHTGRAGALPTPRCWTLGRRTGAECSSVLRSLWVYGHCYFGPRSGKGILKQRKLILTSWRKAVCGNGRQGVSRLTGATERGGG